MPQIQIVKSGDRFIAKFQFDVQTKDLVKAAGFRFDGAQKVWWTRDPEIAAKLDGGDPAAAARRLNDELQAKRRHQEASLAASRAASSNLEIPLSAACRAEGLDYLPYQRAGIEYALQRRDTLIGDEMGLGKTIQVLGLVNADPSISKILVICPASLKLNWEREARRWLVRDIPVEIANGSFNRPGEAGGLVITNYEMVQKLRAQIDAVEWDLLVADESHYLKNKDAQRTHAVLGGLKKARGVETQRIRPIAAKRRVFLSGTPILNRPSELWTLMQALDPEGLGRNWKGYHVRYCNGHLDRRGYWDVSGASNLDELQGRLRASVMVRRLKADVLTELPDKRRQVVPLRPQSKAERDALAGEAKHKEAIERVQKLKAELEKLDPVAAQQAYEAMAAELHEAQATAFTETSKVRHEVGLAKVPQCVEHIKDVLDGSDGKLVVWAHHHDVIDALVEAIAGHLGHHTAVLEADGRMSAAHRDEAVQAFQTNPDARVIVCGIAAMGTGHTLTAASHEVFCELDWTPGRVEQAEDRLHRIGQRDNVLAQHLIYDGSLDARMLGLLVGKANVIKAALDAPDTVLPAVEPVAIPEAPKPEKSRVQQILDRHQFRPVCERCGGRVRQITDPFNGKTAWECVAECGWIGSQRLPEASVPAPEAPKSDELPRTQVQAIHQALRILDGSCDGAIAKDDVGFNGTDTGFGKSLAAQEWLTQRQAKAARKMLLKYHRQIPPDLYATLKG